MESADFLRTLQPFGIQNTLEEWKFCRGIPAPGCIFRPARSNSTKNHPNSNNSYRALTIKDLYRERKLFYKFKYENVPKTKNKPDPVLL
jgi:hypothetical protein